MRHNRWAQRIFLLVAIFGALAAGARQDEPLLAAVEGVVIPVADLDRAVDFYTGVLTFEKTAESETAGAAPDSLEGVFGLRVRTAQLQLGEETIELREYLTPRGRPVPPDSKSNDGWFQHIAIIVRDMDQAYEQLRAHHVRYASPEPQRLPDWNPNAGGIRAFYFLDPDGHSLEILEFPEGKGNPKWRRPTERLFLGIDHTAIAIGDTGRSLAFYRDLLGMTVAGTSENFGPEQERLNHVFGAHLRITAVRGPDGPGIEFLEYLTPRNGRPYPADAQSNDLFHWQTRLRVARVETAAERMRAARTPFISSGIVEHTFLARDPDGHAVRISGE